MLRYFENNIIRNVLPCTPMGSIGQAKRECNRTLGGACSISWQPTCATWHIVNDCRPLSQHRPAQQRAQVTEQWVCSLAGTD